MAENLHVYAYGVIQNSPKNSKSNKSNAYYRIGYIRGQGEKLSSYLFFINATLPLIISAISPIGLRIKL